MVLPVEFYRVSARVIATESAFAEHLRLLKASLSPEVTRLIVASPAMPANTYQVRKGYLAEIDEEATGISHVALESGDMGRAAYLLRALPKIVPRIWRLVGEAVVIHAGPSQLLRPLEIVSILAGFLRRRSTVFVVDIDWRRSAAMNRTTGRASTRNYLMSTWIYDPAFSLQVHFAARFCSLVLLKSPKLVRDYGRGRSHVKNILDAAHSREHVITEEAQQQRVLRLRGRHGPLRLVYFGRYTRYKGIDRMIKAVQVLRDVHQRHVELDLIGTGEDEQLLQAAIRAGDLGDRVRLRGPIQFGPALFGTLQSYDVLLAAPLSSDTPRSALDAMASGLPLIAYDTDYYRDLRELSGAVDIVPWLDDESFARSILALDEDRERLIGMSVAAVEFARNNTQEMWLQQRAEWTRAYCMSQ
jgi:glycosyltransferase involved in cell wall biosynthesis